MDTILNFLLPLNFQLSPLSPAEHLMRPVDYQRYAVVHSARSTPSRTTATVSTSSPLDAIGDGRTSHGRTSHAPSSRPSRSSRSGDALDDSAAPGPSAGGFDPATTPAITPLAPPVCAETAAGHQREFLIRRLFWAIRGGRALVREAIAAAREGGEGEAGRKVWLFKGAEFEGGEHGEAKREVGEDKGV